MAEVERRRAGGGAVGGGELVQAAVARDHHARVAQDGHVFGGHVRRTAHAPGQFGDRQRLALRQLPQDRPARGVAEQPGELFQWEGGGGLLMAVLRSREPSMRHPQPLPGDGERVCAPERRAKPLSRGISARLGRVIEIERCHRVRSSLRCILKSCIHALAGRGRDHAGRLCGSWRETQAPDLTIPCSGDREEVCRFFEHLRVHGQLPAQQLRQQRVS